MKIKIMQQTNFRGVVFGSLLAFMTALVLAGCSAENEDYATKTTESSGRLAAKCFTYSYSFTKTENFGGESFEILCDGDEVVYSTSADYLGFITAPQNDVGENGERIAPRDIDGDRIPDLITQETNGNCCLDYTVISLGDYLREYKLENVGANFELVDLDNDGKFEIKTTDTTFFDNPFGSKFDEPVPEIILESKDGRYIFSRRFMKNISPSNISKRIAEAKQKTGLPDGISSLDKKFIIELIYHGRGDEALNYLDAVYDDTSLEDAKNAMADDIVMTILRSAHWKEISAMNKWKYTQPDDGELACPEFSGRSWLEKTE